MAGLCRVAGRQVETLIPRIETLEDRKPYTNRGLSVDEPFRLLTNALEDARLGHVDGRHGETQLLGRLRAAGAVQGQAPKGFERGRLKLLLHQVEQAAEHVVVVFLIPL